MRYAMAVDTKNVLGAAIVLLPVRQKIMFLMAFAANGLLKL